MRLSASRHDHFSYIINGLLADVVLRKLYICSLFFLNIISQCKCFHYQIPPSYVFQLFQFLSSGLFVTTSYKHVAIQCCCPEYIHKIADTRYTVGLNLNFPQWAVYLSKLDSWTIEAELFNITQASCNSSCFFRWQLIQEFNHRLFVAFFMIKFYFHKIL